MALVAAGVVVSAVVVSEASPAYAATSGPVAVGNAYSADTRVLSVDSTANNTNVRASSYVGGTGAAVDRQRWTFEYIGDTHPYGTTYRIRNVGSGRCLTSSSNGAQVYIADCASLNAQLWHVPRSPAPVGGGYNLRNNGNGRCLDVSAATVGQLVDAFSCYPATWANPETGQYMGQRWKVQFGAFDCAGTGMVMCVRPGRPTFGVMANWHQYPVAFTGPDDASVFQHVTGRTVDAQNVDNVEDYVELGWLSGFDPTFGTTYMAYWQESSPSAVQFHSLATEPGGSAADGRNHTYMALGSDTDQVDIFYDFNFVGTTEGVEGSRLTYAETGLYYAAQDTAAFGQSRENRLQTMDANNLWHRPYLSETSAQLDNVCGNPPTAGSWGQPNTSPWCFSATVHTRAGTDPLVEVDRFEVTKATAAAAPGPAAPQPADSLPGPAIVHNGVDQRQLAACLAVEADRCLQRVPGLAACVAARKVCNILSTTSADTRTRRTAMDAAQAARAAERDLIADGPQGATIPAGQVASLTAAAYTTATGRVLRHSAPADMVHVVSGDKPVAGLKKPAPGGHRYTGFSLVYHAGTGALLYACLGRGCRPAS